MLKQGLRALLAAVLLGALALPALAEDTKLNVGYVPAGRRVFAGLTVRDERTLFETRWYLMIVSQTWWVGFIAVISGWVVSESGRQPWIVFGLLRTADAVSPVPGASVATTLILFVVVYLTVFSFGIYFINRLIARGIQDTKLPEDPPRLAAGHAIEQAP